MAVTGEGIGGAIAGGLFGFGTELFRGYQQKSAQTRFRRRQRRAIESARMFADKAVDRTTSSPLFSQAAQFLESTFGDPTSTPLVESFRNQLRQAGAARGLFFGGAGAGAEAGGVAVAGQQLRQSLLPQSLQFALAPEQLRQSVLASEVPLQVASATGAPIAGLQPPEFIDPFSNALTSAIQGATGGFQLGQEFGGQSRPTNLDGTPGRVSPFLSEEDVQGFDAATLQRLRQLGLIA